MDVQDGLGKGVYVGLRTVGLGLVGHAWVSLLTLSDFIELLNLLGV